MRTVFIINPCAGLGKKFNNTLAEIRRLSSNNDIDVYITKAQGDGSRFVDEYCQKNGLARFIACGGDGTLNEILNGAIEHEGVEIGVVPIGTGNDFYRNFSTDASFFDLEKQISSECVKCDAIKYNTIIGGKKRSGYSANMFNIGFDCAVADMTNSVKKNTFLSGSLAYFISIFISLVKKNAYCLDIEVDGIKKHNGELLLTSIANGCFCGGGLKTNPIASVNDGYLNINIVKDVPRLKFLSLLPRYINGSYLSIKNIDKILTSQKSKNVKITPMDKLIRISIDGEITDAGKTEFEVIHNAFNFVVPKRA